MRWYRRVLAVVALGLMTSVAVSWMLAAAWKTAYGRYRSLTQDERQREPARGEGEGEVRINRHAGLGVVILESTARQQYGPAEHGDPERLADSWGKGAVFPWGRDGHAWPPPNGREGRSARGTGWPWIALWHEYRWNPDPPGVQTLNRGEYVALGGIRIEPSNGTPGAWPFTYPRVLPLRPAWAGLAGDSVVYGAAWAVVLSSVAGARRYRRRRRDRCERCGYSRVGLAAGVVCPECGAR